MSPISIQGHVHRLTGFGPELGTPNYYYQQLDTSLVEDYLKQVSISDLDILRQLDVIRAFPEILNMIDVEYHLRSREDMSPVKTTEAPQANQGSPQPRPTNLEGTKDISELPWKHSQHTIGGGILTILMILGVLLLLYLLAGEQIRKENAPAVVKLDNLLESKSVLVDSNPKLKEALPLQQSKKINTLKVDQQFGQTLALPIHKPGDSYTFESINVDNGTVVNTTERKVILANSEKLVIESKNIQSKSGRVRKLEFTPEWNLIAIRNADGSGVNYSPPLKYYEFPLISGKTWRQTSIETNIKTGEIREHTLSAVVGDWENITVPAGTFRGVKIMIQTEQVDRTNGKKSKGTDTSWYVPELRRGVRSLTSSINPEGIQSKQDIQLIRYDLVK